MVHSISLPAGELAGVPYLDQYFGVWAMRDLEFNAHWQWARGLNVSVHLQSAQAQAARAATAEEPTLQVRDGIAIIGLAGTLMKQQSSYAASSSTVLARRKIRAAVRNPDVMGILLMVESPGGTVAGTDELADEVSAASKQKPVWAYCEDLCASAAYWVASQAERVYANRTATIGSIGTYMVVNDYSGAAEKEGIKVHVIKAGDFKGAGHPGTLITDKQIADWQQRVNQLNEFFIAGVANGRRMSIDQARALADGRVYIGESAKQARLIDGVQTFEQTYSQFVTHARTPRRPATPAAVASPAPSPSPQSNDPIAAWEAAVTAELTASNRCTRAAAVAKVSREKPALRAAYVTAFNRQHRGTGG